MKTNYLLTTLILAFILAQLIHANETILRRDYGVVHVTGITVVTNFSYWHPIGRGDYEQKPFRSNEHGEVVLIDSFTTNYELSVFPNGNFPPVYIGSVSPGNTQ